MVVVINRVLNKDGVVERLVIGRRRTSLVFCFDFFGIYIK